MESLILVEDSWQRTMHENVVYQGTLCLVSIYQKLKALEGIER
jgi:hypothetical protein